MNKMSKTTKTYFLYFIMASFIGWAYEIFLEMVIYHWGYSDRGVLFGPYCPVYGFGVLIFIFCFDKLMKKNGKILKYIKPLLIFVGCMIVATVLELLTSYILEAITGSWPWQTYADYKYNFQGRIALSPSIRFGLGGVIFLYFFKPLFYKAISKLSERSFNTVFYLLLCIISVDLLINLIIHL